MDCLLVHWCFISQLKRQKQTNKQKTTTKQTTNQLPKHQNFSYETFITTSFTKCKASSTTSIVGRWIMKKGKGTELI